MITAIIVNYNSGIQLTACVGSLLASTVPVKVVVSDNASTDDSLARLEAFCAGDERVTVIRNGINYGFSVGCNIGLTHVAGDYVLFINPDCVVPPEAVGRMRDLMDARPQVGMAGCLIRNVDGSEQAGCRRYVPTPWRSLMRVLRLDFLFPDRPRFQTFNMTGTPLPPGPVTVEAISGAFMFVRISALERVGPLDENYFLHCEDLDWCMRFSQQGYDILFVPEVEITHLKGGSRASSLFVEWHKHKGMTRFYLKFFRQRYPWIMMLAVVIAVHVRYMLLVPWLLWQGRAKATGGAVDPCSYLCFTLPWQALTATVAERTVIVSGATSQIGRMLLPRLAHAGYRVIALSRRGQPGWAEDAPGEVYWLKGDMRDAAGLALLPDARALIHLAPLAILPERLPAFARLGVRRVVAFSSSSKYSKARSPVAAERAFADRLVAAEDAVAQQGQALGMHWTIFRPTLIYGCGMDRNITLIRRIVRWAGFFPLLGAGSGLRQPVHADDLAAACVAVLDKPVCQDRGYELSGGEVLSYRAMVTRIFVSLQLKVRLVTVPVALFATLLRLIALVPRYRDFNVAMAQRMNEDLAYRHDEARRDFGYQPRKFLP